METQQPDHDGQHYFQPICVEQRIVGGALYDYQFYCGSCRQRMGHMGEIKAYCPRCGKGVARYVFSMGTEIYLPRDSDDHLPDVWPVATIDAESGLTETAFAEAYAKRRMLRLPTGQVGC